MKPYRQLLADIEKADENALFEMANLTGRYTGLPLMVWISPRGQARHDVCVKVAYGPKVLPSQMISVVIRPEVRVVEGAQNEGV